MPVNRKLFLVQVLGSGIALKLAGCGGGGDTASPSPAPSPAPAPGAAPAPAPPPLTNCTGLVFSANHGHVLTIPVADLSSSVTKTYNVQGTGGHNHQVTLSPGQLAQLRAGGMVSVSTTFDAGHAHTMNGGCN
jgi:hypothetical protein